MNIKDLSRVKEPKDNFDAYCYISGRKILNGEIYWVYNSKPICKEVYKKIERQAIEEELESNGISSKKIQSEKYDRLGYKEKLRELEKEQLEYELYEKIKKDTKDVYNSCGNNGGGNNVRKR